MFKTPLLATMSCVRMPKFIILVLISLFSINFKILSQESEPNPIDMIIGESDGKISIDIPESILEILLHNSSEDEKRKASLKTGVNKTTGYRIQVFSDGRNPSSLANRAKARGSAVLQKFPKYKGQVYTFSKSPNWFTRIGNFLTVEEATEAMDELKKAFPSFASDMRIVKSNIIIIKQ